MGAVWSAAAAGRGEGGAGIAVGASDPLTWTCTAGKTNRDGLGGLGELRGPLGGKRGVDIGVKASGALTWTFTAGKTNCDGLGGLVALLGALGIDVGVLGVLPAGSGGMSGSFAKNLSARQFTVAGVVNVSA